MHHLRLKPLALATLLAATLGTALADEGKPA